MGTCTVAPVSTMAFFIALVAVLPLTPGSHSVILSSTKFSGSTENAVPLSDYTVTISFSLIYLSASSTCERFKVIISKVSWSKK